MKYRIVIQPEAQLEIEEAYIWLAEQSKQYAINWYNRLIKTVNTLEYLPNRCPIAPENDAFDEEIRQLLHGKKGRVYRILYTINKNIVYILHIRHSARDYIR